MLAILYKSPTPYWSEVPDNLEQDKNVIDFELLNEVDFSQKVADKISVAFNAQQGDVIVIAGDDLIPKHIIRVGLSHSYPLDKPAIERFIYTYLVDKERNSDDTSRISNTSL